MADLPYRKLIVWQKAHALAMSVLDLAESGSLAKQWELRDQIIAAALSVPANIAEGNGRSTPLDYASFLDRARGSLFETDYWREDFYIANTINNKSSQNVQLILCR